MSFKVAYRGSSYTFIGACGKKLKGRAGCAYGVLPALSDLKLRTRLKPRGGWGVTFATREILNIYGLLLLPVIVGIYANRL